MSQVIVLDIPPPISVNKTRRIDYRSMGPKADWVVAADTCVMLKGRLPTAIKGPWELTVTMGEGWRIDPDNGLKEIIDYCRRLNLIENDSPKFARRIVMEWGEAPEGCRVTIKPT
jgi:Holliday junction resolvase RusA-like endonuclease